jgi:hypothetical protein
MSFSSVSQQMANGVKIKEDIQAPIKGTCPFLVLFFSKSVYEMKRNEYENCKMMVVQVRPLRNDGAQRSSKKHHKTSECNHEFIVKCQ